MHRLRKYRPGVEIRLVVHVQHHEEQRLERVELVFSNQERMDKELVFRGTPVPPVSRSPFPGRPIESEAEMSLTVPGDVATGLYKVDRVEVETFGGTPYRYHGDELAALGEMVFEVVAEPDHRPGIRAGFLD